MVDDWIDPNDPKQMADLNTCLMPILHDKIEYYLDPGSNQLSASRWGIKKITTWGIVAAFVLVAGGFILNMPGAFTPAAVIITGLATSNGAVYWGSTSKKYRCNGE